MCTSLARRFTLFDCSLGMHTSRSKISDGDGSVSAYDGKERFRWFGNLSQAETLVTVSPCEFPLRCYFRIIALFL